MYASCSCRVQSLSAVESLRVYHTALQCSISPPSVSGLAYHFNMAGAESINKDKKRILFVKIDKYILTIIEKCVTITLN